MIASGPTSLTAGRWSPAPMSAPPAWSGVISTCPTRITCSEAGPIMVREQARSRFAGGEKSTVFVAIGGVPNTDWAADTAIVRDPGGYLVTGPDLLTNGKAPASWPLERAPYYLETAVPGSFAAGDVRHRSIKRVATAAGEGAMA